MEMGCNVWDQQTEGALMVEVSDLQQGIETPPTRWSRGVSENVASHQTEARGLLWTPHPNSGSFSLISLMDKLDAPCP